MTTMSVTDPSLTVYKRLQDLYPNTLKCPCSNITVPYSSFTLVSITLHQVCSSDFISDSWITQMTLLLLQEKLWVGMSAGHFRLLSNLCQTINDTINDALSRLTIRSFITLNVPTEHSFNNELNATLEQFIETLIINFNLLVDTSRLLTQSDQPLVVRYHTAEPSDDSAKYAVTAYQSSVQEPLQVGCYLKEKATALPQP